MKERQIEAHRAEQSSKKKKKTCEKLMISFCLIECFFFFRCIGKKLDAGFEEQNQKAAELLKQFRDATASNSDDNDQQSSKK